MIQTKSYAANTHVANVPCSSQKGLAKETFAGLNMNMDIDVGSWNKGTFIISWFCNQQTQSSKLIIQ